MNRGLACRSLLEIIYGHNRDLIRGRRVEAVVRMDGKTFGGCVAWGSRLKICTVESLVVD